MKNEYQKRAEKLSKAVGAKEVRKIKARREKDSGIWFGLGMFGLVGWSALIWMCPPEAVNFTASSKMFDIACPIRLGSIEI
ncbi:MAG: hypothetical protein HF982_14010 [Desulfobacteraceae bacterium]|nr:hypothetical protein [Desulfobacteraceae bacterium]MBC2720673.1 hypothetical protein [Desulfobacteraceae bacterium]